MSVNPEECALELLDVVPLVMSDIRCEMRSRRTPDLTVPQFRTLVFVNSNTGSSLSEVAEYTGLTLPSASKLVDELIKHGLMVRKENPNDRRRLSLAITHHGVELLEASRKGTLKYLAEKLRAVNADNRDAIVKAMRAMRPVFQN
jgi:DNA-binding MarR family transcriptional regulator